MRLVGRLTAFLAVVRSSAAVPLAPADTWSSFSTLLMQPVRAGERELVVPSHLGYGTAGAPPKIPPDAALHFAIKLLRVGDGEDAAKGGKRRRARGARGGARAAKKKLAAKLRAAGEK